MTLLHALLTEHRLVGTPWCELAYPGPRVGAVGSDARAAGVSARLVRWSVLAVWCALSAGAAWAWFEAIRPGA